MKTSTQEVIESFNGFRRKQLQSAFDALGLKIRVEILDIYIVNGIIQALREYISRYSADTYAEFLDSDQAAKHDTGMRMAIYNTLHSYCDMATLLEHSAELELEKLTAMGACTDTIDLPSLDC